MWALFSEWCADVFGVTRRGRSSYAWVLGAGLVFGLVLSVSYGWPGLILLVAGLLTMAWAARDVAVARDRAWKAACLPLDSPHQRPNALRDPKAFGPTVVALRHLASAVDAARRGEYVRANESASLADRDLLKPEEEQLLDAVRGMVSLGLGDSKRAAQAAAVALPTGSDDLDASLGRAMVREAWGNADRLRAIESAWSRAGVGAYPGGPLSRLRKLMRVRIEVTRPSRDQATPDALDGIDPDEARVLSSEARAIGDDLLAADLESRGRPSAYR